MKWMISILWSEIKVNISNGVHDFTLFKILKDKPTLTSYTLLDILTSNPDLSFKMNSIHREDPIPFNWPWTATP
jgi:hypothetical protein